MSRLESSPDEVAATVVEALRQRKRSVFARIDADACREHVGAILTALGHAEHDWSDGLRGAVSRMLDTLVDARLTFIDIRHFITIMRASLRDVSVEVPAEVVALDERLTELLLLLTMRYVVIRERQVQQLSTEREVERLESRLVDLKASLEEKSRLLNEVEKLNEELRRQIAERSSRLMDLLVASKRELRLQSELQLGSLLANTYRVHAKLGEGGMGAVYEVERTTDGERLAVKIIKSGANHKHLARFVREAQLLARLTHPNLIAIHDVDFDSGVLYIVMELAADSLSDHHERVGQLSWNLAVLRQICEALAALHEQSVVHRDLKPQNILVMAEDAGEGVRAKLADFGIALVLEDMREPSSPPAARPAETLADTVEPDSLFTGTGVLLGTPNYMAPELARGSHHAQAPSDMFSVGVIAYEQLLGSLPFAYPPVFIPQAPKSSMLDEFRRCPELPDELAVLFARCLDWTPQARPSAREVARALGSTS